MFMSENLLYAYFILYTYFHKKQTISYKAALVMTDQMRINEDCVQFLQHNGVHFARLYKICFQACYPLTALTRFYSVLHAVATHTWSKATGFGRPGDLPVLHFSCFYVLFLIFFFWGGVLSWISWLNGYVLSGLCLSLCLLQCPTLL